MKRKLITTSILFLTVLTGISQEIFRYIDQEKDKISIAEDKFFISITDTSAIEQILSRNQYIQRLNKIDSKGTHIALTKNNKNFATHSLLDYVENVSRSSDLIIGTSIFPTVHSSRSEDRVTLPRSQKDFEEWGN